MSRLNAQRGQTRGTGVSDYGSGHPFNGQGSSASEMPPLMPTAGPSAGPHPASSSGGPDRVSDPIPFRRPMPSAGLSDELHAADPVADDLLPGTQEPVLGPTGRPMPVLPEPAPISIHGNAR